MNFQCEPPDGTVRVDFRPDALPAASLLVCVVVPVRNEAAHLIKTLDALKNQIDLRGNPVGFDKYEVLLLANNCTDNTYQIATEYQRAWPQLALRVAQVQLSEKIAHIGTARRILMDAAHQRFALIRKPGGIIASTDGDTLVAANWVSRIIDEINGGVDAVGGRILVDQRGDAPNVYHSQDEIYRTLAAHAEALLDPLEHDPWPRHHQYFGANLAVTCEMYDFAGRLPQVPYLEDNAFFKALVRRDARIRHSTAVEVTTSDRHIGRVPIGLSEQLRKWAGMEERLEPYLVPSAAEIISRTTCRRILRTLWKKIGAGDDPDRAYRSAAAELPGLDVDWLRSALAGSGFFGELWEKAEPMLRAEGGQPMRQLVDITQAITDLTAFVKTHRPRALDENAEPYEQRSRGVSDPQ